MTSHNHTTGDDVNIEPNPATATPPKKKATRSLADDLAAQPSVNNQSAEAGRTTTTPGEYLVGRFPALAEKYGAPLAETRVDLGNGEYRLIVKAIEDGFFAAYLGTEGCPEAPAVFDHSTGKFFVYDKGWYTETTSETLEIKVRELLLEAEKACTDPCLDSTGLKKLRSHRSLSAVVQAAKGTLLVRDDFWVRPPDIVPCKNGVLGWNANEGRVLSPHSPKHHLRGVLGVDYVPNATCPRFMELLNRALPSDDVELLQRVIGSLLLGRNIAQKFSMLMGTPQSGKGVIVRIVIGLLGPENVTTMRTAAMNSRFEIGRYVKKLLLYAPDVDSRFLHELGAYLIKAITGEDPFSPEYKNSNVTPPAKPLDTGIIITCNSRLTIHLQDDRAAWERRLIVIPFVRESVTEQMQITGLSDKLQAEEGAGILNWMLDGLEAYITDDFKLRLNDRQREVVKDLLSDSESSTCFARECVVQEEGGRLTVERAYTGYTQFCSARNWTPLPKRKFEQDFKAVVHKLYKVTQRHDLRVGDGWGRGWNGIMLTGHNGTLGDR
jgi:P4 family phage/plasmid primase-like protien